MALDSKKSVAVQLPMELYEQIKGCAKKRDVPVSWYIRRALRFYVWHEQNDSDRLEEPWKYWQ